MLTRIEISTLFTGEKTQGISQVASLPTRFLVHRVSGNSILCHNELATSQSYYVVMRKTQSLINSAFPLPHFHCMEEDEARRSLSATGYLLFVDEF